MGAIKDSIADVKDLIHSIRGLQSNVKKLQQALPAVTEFQNEVQRSVDKWQFKSKPRIDKIKEATDQIKPSKD